MNLVLGFVGTAYAGKDTTNGIISDCLFQAVMTGQDNKQSFKDEKTSVVGHWVSINDQQKLVIWHTPLALEVKREYVQENPGVDLDKLLYDSAYKNQHREGLIRIGDGRRETVDPLYWLKKVQTTIQCLLTQYPIYQYHVFSITDMRYENELPHIETYCCENNIPILSIGIETDLAIILSRMSPEAASEYARKHKNNPSERNVKRVHADVRVNNSGTRLQLTTQVQYKVMPIIRTILF